MNESVVLQKGNRYEYAVHGMHCAACEMVVETVLKKTPEVKNVDASLNRQQVIFEVEHEIEEQELLLRLNKALDATEYTVAKEKLKRVIHYKELTIAFLVATLIMGIFLSMQKLGIANILGGKTFSLPLVFLIGIVASLSSCMALVGGLVLSISSSYAKSNDKVVPLVSFHVARLIGFFILGGVIGGLGSFLTISPTGYLIIGSILFLVMVVMGLNLLDIFSFTQSLQLKMPKAIAKKTVLLQASQHWGIPLLMGVLTFFLPCGFTQSMQFAAIASGSVVTGALTMLVFALGTLPVFTVISFTSVAMAKSLQSGIFFKTAGFLVLFFAVFNIIATLVAAGIIMPIF